MQHEQFSCLHSALTIQGCHIPCLGEPKSMAEQAWHMAFTTSFMYLARWLGPGAYPADSKLPLGLFWRFPDLQMHINGMLRWF